jgi:hypothetical protein
MVDIKRCIEEFKPEGFRLEKVEDDYMKLMTKIGSIETQSFDWDNLFYSLFLQRVIEAINRQDNSITIQQMEDCIMVMIKINEDIFDSTDYYYDVYSSIDFTKEQAIIYILKQLQAIIYIQEQLDA